MLFKKEIFTGLDGRGGSRPVIVFENHSYLKKV